MQSRLIPILVLLGLVLWGCREPQPPADDEAAEATSPKSTTAQPPPTAAPAAPGPALSEAQKATERRVKERAKAFGAQLKGALMGAMQEGGPVQAMRLCSTQAQAMTQDAQGDDVALGRASLRLRNPDNRPPAWVQSQLEAWGERPAAGLEPIVLHDVGDVRLLVPLAVEGPCLVCHGPRESLGPEVKAVLSERYPEDRATGYAVGDLRGVLWAIGRVEPDPTP